MTVESPPPAAAARRLLQQIGLEMAFLDLASPGGGSAGEAMAAAAPQGSAKRPATSIAPIRTADGVILPSPCRDEAGADPDP